MNRAVVVGIGSALALLGSTARAVEGGVELNDVILDGDHGTVHGRIDVPGGGPGGFSLRVRRAEVRDGELYLAGPLEVTFGRVTQTLSTAAMRLSDADGVCDVMAVTVPELHLDHFGVDVDSAAVDISVSATTSNGRALANLLCGATHLLDDPGPLATASVPTLSELINRSLPRTTHSRRPAHASAQSQSQSQSPFGPGEGNRGGERTLATQPEERWAEPAPAQAQAQSQSPTVDEGEPVTPPPVRPSRRAFNHARQTAQSSPHGFAPTQTQTQTPPAQSGQYTPSPYYPSAQGAPPSAPAAATQSTYPQPAPYESVRPAQRRLRPTRSIDDDEESSPSDD